MASPAENDQARDVTRFTDAKRAEIDRVLHLSSVGRWTLDVGRWMLTAQHAAFPLARKLRLYYKAQGQLDKAATWAMPKSEWQRIREDALLAKAKALRDDATPLTTSLPPAGGAFGITADVLAAFSLLVDAYEEEIGKPGTARSQRKAQGAELRPRYALADVDLDDIDDLIEDLRDKGDAEQLFVETYFNLRRLGAGGSDGSAGVNKGGPAKPTPPAP